ncbi:trans-aconitate 2-methyltransferase [Nocardioides zeae]|uniref:Trans-aconitate 2-methyltransferase n=1 Tax=Nocardioides imazamoxiresistens TaxID=3231893 RepID=A0ABU3PWN5_9ACTN|nr:trans-aconitate 2-methyltransferase [Nocardioides zeae]MDT9593650.1 trans-aconitate 2-methyltransferase [Nocardioides zeae]
MAWDPTHYLRYADERGRPFVELLARVDAEPRRIVDLGCGPGNVTALLARRWPEASVLGVDSSPEMIERARADHAEHPTLRFETGDLRTWAPQEAYDLVVSNATLQWVPGHLELLPRLLGAVAPGGTLAFSVPGNFDEPSHTLRRDLAAQQPYAAHLADIATPGSHDAATYLAALAAEGADVDAWETTYLHVLRGEDPVLTWVSATGARPTLEALPDDLRHRFTEEFAAALRSAYPVTEVGGEPGVVLPFRRVFVVARRG